jgi:hypothetical protein
LTNCYKKSFYVDNISFPEINIQVQATVYLILGAFKLMLFQLIYFSHH